MSETASPLLKEIISELMNLEISLVQPLFKLQYLGKLINNEELIKYTAHELKGYTPGVDEIPAYRNASSKLSVRIQAGWHTHTKELPLDFLPSSLREKLKSIPIKESITVIEGWTKNPEGKSLGIELPIQMVGLFQETVEKVFVSDTKVGIVGASLYTDANIAGPLLTTVRSKLLDLVMELGSGFGYDVNVSSFTKQKEKINQTIHNYMKTEIQTSGDGNVINTGHNAQLNATINISKGDVNQLKEELEKLGVDQCHIEDLEGILKAYPVKDGQTELPEPASNWIGKVLGVGGKIAIGTSAGLLVQLVKTYFGLG